MKRKAAVICAMESEAEKIVAALSDAKTEKVGVMDFVRGFLGENEVVVARCGVGKVFAAMCTEALILSFQPDLILNSGVAGSLSERLKIADLCISTGFVQYDFDTTPIGDPPHFIGGGIEKSILPANKAISDALLAIAKKEGLRAIGGIVATGDRFLAQKEEKRRLGKEIGALVCEMEGGAAAQVAASHATPFCAIRAVSDSLSDDSAMEFSAFTRLAAEQSAKLILAFLAQ